MTAPASFNTPDRVIRMAMTDCGKLQDGDDPTPEQYANHMNRLNDLINFWQTQGLKLWLQYDLEIPLVVGQRTYTLGPGGNVDMTKPTRILDSCYYLDADDVRRPLVMLSREEFTRLSQQTVMGSINSFFVDKQASQLIISVWPTADTITATGTIHLLIQRQLPNVTTLNQTMEFPQEWFLALRWGLADEISTGQPQQVVDRCAIKAGQYLTALEDWDVEDAATVFQPDHRMALYRGMFQ